MHSSRMRTAHFLPFRGVPLSERPRLDRHSSLTETRPPDRRTSVITLPLETSFVSSNKYLQTFTEADPGFPGTGRRKGRQHISGQNLPKTARKLDQGLGCVQNVTTSVADPGGLAMPPGPVKISHKKIAAKGGRIDFMFLGPPLPGRWICYCIYRSTTGSNRS